METFTSWYIFFQLVVFAIVLIVLRKFKGWSEHTNTAASILTTVGILGTFIGIFIGLQDFEPNDLQNSIENLLSGLKLAFGTSIIGIISTLFLKGIISPIARQREKKNQPDRVEEVIDQFVMALRGVETSGESALALKLDRLLEVLKGKYEKPDTVLGGIGYIKTALTEKNGRTVSTQLQGLLEVVSEPRLARIEAALSDNEGNLLTELRNMRQESSTQHAALINEFQQFSQNVAESVAKLATDELIEALKAVIQDFNTKLTEQFGDNFKQLNEAVGRTVEWQEQYRQQMDELSQEFRLAAESIEHSRAAVSSTAQSLMTIEDRSESLVEVAEKLDPLLHTLNDQLEAFSELRQNALDAFPEIEGRLDNLTEKFSAAVLSAIEDSQQNMTRQQEELRKHNDLLRTEIQGITAELQQTVEKNKTDIENQVSILHAFLSAEVKTLLEAFSDLRQRTLGVFPEIEERLDSLTEKFSEAVLSAIEDSQASMAHQQTEMKKHNDLLRKETQGIAMDLKQVVERNKEDIENHVDVLHTYLRSQVKTLDEVLSKELENSLKILAGNITSLSDGFVDNYNELIGPYTQALTSLQQLVNASRRGLR